MINLVHTDCLHEEQFLGQSRAIEKLNAEMNYKKEKLDDLKKDNKRMEEKIDEIRVSLNELILKSKTDDDNLEKRFALIETELDKRIVALETEQKVLKEQEKNNRDSINLKIAVIGIVLTVITICISLLPYILNLK